MARDSNTTLRYANPSYIRRGRTAFYGSLDGGDLVLPIEAVQPSIFQNVAPFYERSLTLSPRELKKPTNRRRVVRERAGNAVRRKAPQTEGQGRRLDIVA